jgi:hypothetical protein
MIIHKQEQVRRLNDALRKSHIGGRLQVTAGVNGLGLLGVMAAAEAVARFDAFLPDNDPHAEHDFGSVTVMGQQLFWKIDYYDPTFAGHADNPADPQTCRRVLTIMLASEY